MRSRDRVLMAALFAASACADQGSSVAREQIGDTVVVRAGAPELWPDTARLVEELRIGVVDGPPEYTFGVVRNVAVDASGNIHVLDASLPGVRVYDPDGRHLRTIGRRGEGPGELSNPWGMTILPDGRLLVRDFRLGRINVYSPEGDALDQWSIPTGFATGAAQQVDTAGRVYTTVLREPRADGIMRTGLMRLHSTGQVIDTVTAPYADYPVQMLVARMEQEGGSSSSYGEAPFSPQPVAALTPEGDFVAAITDRYAVTRFTDPPVLRFERTTTPIPISDEEREDVKALTTLGFQGTQPNWSWTGPELARQKPPVVALRVADDSRIWVSVAAPSARVPRSADADPRLPDTWVQPAVYDVFEPDGRYLGVLKPPEGLRIEVMRGDRVWGVVRDELGVAYAVRMRIQGEPPP